ncbi:MAG: hypothetical protein HUU55_01045 [Myxococcales bacterium]|nr:hypothetical protein [Myxococcales bacterium]
MSWKPQVGIAVVSVAVGATLAWFIKPLPEGAKTSPSSETVSEATTEQAAAMRSPLELRVEFQPIRGPKKPSAELVYRGKRYTPPAEVPRIEKSEWNKGTPESSYAGVLSANLSNDREWILETFIPESRGEVREAMTEDAVQRNAAYAEQVLSEAILEKIDYGQYVILVTQAKVKDGSVYVSSNPMVKTNDGWLLTKELADDPFVAMVLWGLKFVYEAKPR